MTRVCFVLARFKATSAEVYYFLREIVKLSAIYIAIVMIVLDCAWNDVGLS